MGHLVLAGAGHAHMTTLCRIAEIVRYGHQVTVIGPSEFHYYSGMGPGLLGMTYTKKDTRFNIKRIVEHRGATFIRDKVVRIDWRNKAVVVNGGMRVHYDVLSCNLGSGVAGEINTRLGKAVYTVKPIEELVRLQEDIVNTGMERPVKVIVIGGGPSSAEVAGNLVQLAEKAGLKGIEVTVRCRSTFMSGFSPRIAMACRELLSRCDVQIEEGVGEIRFKSDGVDRDSAGGIDADFIVLATGVYPSKVFANSSMTCGPEGGMAVNQFLQSEDSKDIFGGGDCVYFKPRPLAKVGVYAVRQNRVLYTNILAALGHGSMQSFDPGSEYMLIFNLGKRSGVLAKRGVVLKGKIAFLLKDFIDRRFMARYS